MASVNRPISKHHELRIVNTEVIVPPLPMRQHMLPLSNIDLTLPPVSVHVFFCYKTPSPRTFASALSHLKTSLSRVLVSYYVFAGRMVIDGIGLPNINCNNKGVHLTQAYAAAPLSHLNLYKPNESVQGRLVPLLSNPFQEDGHPVFTVQVTEFSCGGIVVGCTFDHRVADAYSANMFFTSWANLSRNDSSVSPNPCFTRSALCLREYPTYSAEIEKMYVKLTPQENDPHPPPVSSRIYHLDAKNVMDLQFNANKNGNKYTKLEAFSAYLWKLLVRNKKVKDTVSCSKIGIVVDGRPRLREIGVPVNYFGNVILLPFAESNSRYVENEPLCCSAGLIHGAIQSTANGEHFQSLIDLVETRKPTPVTSKLYCREENVESSGPAVLVSSGLRFALYEIDFGWGRPKFGSYHFPLDGEAGYVMPTQSPAGDGSWIVYMHLALEQLYAIESDPNRILLPISQEFLHLA